MESTSITDVLNHEVLGGLTVLHLLAAVVIGLVAFRLIRWVFGRRSNSSDYMSEMSCPACGWTGQVSKYARQCPSCNERL